jgi:hypothetical protein
LGRAGGGEERAGGKNTKASRMSHERGASLSNGSGQFKGQLQAILNFESGKGRILISPVKILRGLLPPRRKRQPVDSREKDTGEF